MLIGILETDSFTGDTKEKYGSYPKMFQHLFLSVDNQITFKVYPVINGVYPENIDSCDAYLITGSQYSAYDNERWIARLSDYIVSLNQQRKKLIGICFGHQIIAQALGGRVKKYDKGWCIGNTNSRITMEKPWMQSNKLSFSILVSHQDQVYELPELAELIASSESCKYSSFQIADHILTFQGHPEYTEDYFKDMMKTLLNAIGEVKVKEAQNSLMLPVDNLLVAMWIISFIKNDVNL